jgi:hypothetical protein
MAPRPGLALFAAPIARVLTIIGQGRQFPIPRAAARGDRGLEGLISFTKYWPDSPIRADEVPVGVAAHS